MTVAVVGSRTFGNPRLLTAAQYREDLSSFFAFLDRIRCERGDFTVISGGAPGADRLAEAWARSRGLPFECYHADWNRWGKAAGPRRNREMVASADLLACAWDGESPGTHSTIEAAWAKRIPVLVHSFEPRESSRTAAQTAAQGALKLAP